MSVRSFFLSIEAVLVLAALWVGWAVWRFLPSTQQPAPVAAVREGTVTLAWRAQGELRAVHTDVLRVPGAKVRLRIARLAPAGSFAAAGDLIAEFDAAEAQAGIEERKIETERLAAQISKARAELALDESEDRARLLHARFSVRRAELDVKRNELLPPAEALRNTRALDDARERLDDLESGNQNRRGRDVAELVLLRSRAAESQRELEQDRRGLAGLRVVAPHAGWVALARGVGDSLTHDAVAPSVRAGDELDAGAAVAEIRDPSRLELTAWANDNDDTRLQIGQTAKVWLDAWPDRPLQGEVTSVNRDWADTRSPGPGGRHEVTIRLDMWDVFAAAGVPSDQVAAVAAGRANEARAATAFAQVPAPGSPWRKVPRPGTPGRVEVLTGTYSNSLSVPRASVFGSGGGSFVWVRRAGRFVRQRVAPLHGDNAWIVVAGNLRGGEEVALTTPPPRRFLP
jgi:HlyD family secretion protein